MTSPMQRSLAHLRAQGFRCYITEKWNHFSRRRIDAFGFGDILAYKPGFGVALVQTTTTENLRARQKKALKVLDFAGWRRAGAHVIFNGWNKHGVTEVAYPPLSPARTGVQLEKRETRTRKQSGGRPNHRKDKSKGATG